MLRRAVQLTGRSQFTPQAAFSRIMTLKNPFYTFLDYILFVEKPAVSQFYLSVVISF
jgi:hypothetical protein